MLVSQIALRVFNWIPWSLEILNTSGWNMLMDVCHVFTGSFHVCVEYLKEGHLVALAPGGVLEAQFGDENYHLIWGKRIGFAKVALQAQVVCFCYLSIV